MINLGKILVFLNLALSVGMAALALGLYSNRIEWAGAKPNESEGEIQKLNVEIKNQQGLFAPAVHRWNKEKTDLERQEALQARARKFYAEKLDLLVKGKGPGQPIDVLVFKDGKMQLDANGLPVLQASPDKRLVGRDPQEQELKATDRRIAEAIEQTGEIMKQEETLTKELNGNQGRPKGLRDLLAEMLAAAKRADEELLYVKRERINGREAAASVVNRQRQLRNREDALKRQKVALDTR